MEVFDLARFMLKMLRLTGQAWLGFLKESMTSMSAYADDRKEATEVLESDGLLVKTAFEL